MQLPVKCFYEISEDMVQILIMMKIQFREDPEAEGLFCGAPSSSEPGLFSDVYLFGFGFKPVSDDFARMNNAFAKLSVI